MNSHITMATSVGPPGEFSVAIQSNDGIVAKKRKVNDVIAKTYAYIFKHNRSTKMRPPEGNKRSRGYLFEAWVGQVKLPSAFPYFAPSSPPGVSRGICWLLGF